MTPAAAASRSAQKQASSGPELRQWIAQALQSAPPGTERRSCLDRANALPWEFGVKPAAIEWCLREPSQRGCTNHIHSHNTENSPLVLNSSGIQGSETVLCRTPKVGSLMLRSIALAQANARQWKPVTNGKPWRRIMPFNTLANDHTHDFMRHDRAYTEAELTRLQHAPKVLRLMWVRHPITRVLSGWRFTTPPELATPARFAAFCRGELRRLYDASCGGASQLLSLHPQRQHYLPPQHCRCGRPCGVRWRTLPLEACPIQRVLRSHLGNLSALPPTDELRANVQERFNATAFLAPVLPLLNKLTATEQAELGYCPLEIRTGEVQVTPGCTASTSCEISMSTTSLGG